MVKQICQQPPKSIGSWACYSFQNRFRAIGFTWPTFEDLSFNCWISSPYKGRFCWMQSKMLESRLETLQWGRNLVLIWGITKPFQKMKFLALYSKSMQLWSKHLILELWTLCMYSKELHFLERFGDTSNQNYVAGPTVTFPI